MYFHMVIIENIQNIFYDYDWLLFIYLTLKLPRRVICRNVNVASYFFSKAFFPSVFSPHKMNTKYKYL